MPQSTCDCAARFPPAIAATPPVRLRAPAPDYAAAPAPARPAETAQWCALIHRPPRSHAIRAAAARFAADWPGRPGEWPARDAETDGQQNIGTRRPESAPAQTRAEIRSGQIVATQPRNAQSAGDNRARFVIRPCDGCHRAPAATHWQMGYHRTTHPPAHPATKRDQPAAQRRQMFVRARRSVAHVAQRRY